MSFRRPQMTTASDRAFARVVLARLEVRDLVEILDAVCHQHHVTREDVCGRSVASSASSARKAVWRAIREATCMSLAEIGRLFGRDHSTISLGIRKPAPRARKGAA